MTPTADTPDCQRYTVASQFADLDMHGLLTVYRHCCDRAAVTLLLLLLSRLMSRTGMAPAVKRGGCGACGKGTNGGKQDETVFWGDTKPVVGCRSRLAKEGGLNEGEDNWIRLQ
eukprot:scaffold32298_cov60-Attheya_sp.AAC.1